MKFRQYKNGNKFIVFDSSDCELLPEKIHSLLRASDAIESIVDNGTSIQVFFADINISNEDAREFIYQRVANTPDSSVHRINCIEELEQLNPTLHDYISQLHQGRYEHYKEDLAGRKLLLALYHFFIYDFTCRFRSSDLLWCLPFFKLGVFDVYGQFHGHILIRDFELFSKNTSNTSKRLNNNDN